MTTLGHPVMADGKLGSNPVAMPLSTATATVLPVFMTII